MEAALRDLAIPVTTLRAGMIYGVGDPYAREWPLVNRVRRGTHRLELPASRGERVAQAIVACLERAPEGFFACNVVDPYGWTYAGLAAQIGKILDWHWEPAIVGPDSARHPFQVRYPFRRTSCAPFWESLALVVQPDAAAGLSPSRLQ
jgi:nucleoside-diphosphate-sugar epimerase